MNKVLFVLSILFYPIVDIIRIVIIRIKEKKSPFEADKRHIHHLVMAKVKSHSLATMIIVLVSILIMIFMQFLFN